MKMNKIVFFLFLAPSFISCAGPYALSSPPPKSEWVRTKAIEVREINEEEKRKNFLTAKMAAVELFAAIAGKQWSAAVSYLSSSTRAMLKKGSPSGSDVDVLSSGTWTEGDREIIFNPMSVFLIEDLTDIRDEYNEEKKQENAERIELFAIDGSGKGKKLIMLLENGEWKLHTDGLEQ